jgi:hypothetical protein
LDSMAQTRFGWLRIASCGGLLLARWWTFGCHKEIYAILWKAL